METLQVTTKTSAQIDADFEVVFKDFEPPEAPHIVTQKEWLAPYRKAILRQRRRGLTWDQIAAGMAKTPIGEQVTARILAKVIGGKAKTRKTTRKRAKKATPAARPKPVPAASKRPPPQPASVPEPVPPPEPEPEEGEVQASGLPKAFRAPFNRAALKILEMGYSYDVATTVLAEEWLKEFGEGVDPMNEFIEAALAEFDRLNYATAKAKFQIKPDEWEHWRQKWRVGRGLTE